MWAYVVLSLIALKSVHSTENPRIIIVGAGASGIAAATKLLEHGFENVLILEAEDRIGGRIDTVDFDGYKIDLGAQWVHGQKGNVAYELASPLGLLDNSTDLESFFMYESSGNRIDSDVDSNILNYANDVQQKISALPPDHNYTSVGDFYEAELSQYFAEHGINGTLHRELLRLFNLTQIGYDAADTWHDVSLKSYAEYETCEGMQNVVWIDGGYKTILEILMKKIPDPQQELPVMNHTILNAEVAKIDYSNEDGTVKVTTSAGTEYIADHVIVTVSLGVLKAEYETMFHPPLPEDKVTCIKFLGFGSVGKTFLAFEEPWWQNTTDFRGFLFLWTDEDIERMQDDPNLGWLNHVIGYFTVHYKPRLLGGWILGNGSKNVETLSDEYVYNETMHWLRTFVSNDFEVPEAKAMIRSKWFTNKHFRGTYSYHSVDTEKTTASAEGLSLPIETSGKPVILFAGEATNKKHYSTVHGAIETGWREAQRIIDYTAKQ